MATTNLTWNQDRVEARVTAVMIKRGQIAATVVERQVKARVDTPYPPASLPGQPPHRRRGVLQRSIKAVARLRPKRIRIAVSVSAMVGKWNLGRLLQKGTRPHGNSPGMAARPFIGLPSDARTIVDILSGRRRS